MDSVLITSSDNVLICSPSKDVQVLVLSSLSQALVLLLSSVSQVLVLSLTAAVLWVGRRSGPAVTCSAGRFCRGTRPGIGATDMSLTWSS